MSESPASELLVARSLFCERDDRLLFADLDFSVSGGQVLQIAGPNGSGKTTLLRILAGLYQSYQGELLYRGQAINDQTVEYNASMLFVGHKSAIRPSLTVLENLRFLISLQQQCPDSQLLKALEKVGLAGYEDVLCQHLSAGQSRRVALARLWLSDARIWILDEIFTAIDQSGVAQLEAFLASKAEQGVAIILTTHHQLDMPGLSKITLGAPV